MQAFLSQMPQQIVNGLTLGAVYALIALGYSMVYGILGLLNFAHGDVFMVGAFIGYGVLNVFVPDQTPLIPAVLVIVCMMAVTMLGTGIIGMAIERVAYRPLRNAPRIAPLISALGVSFFLQNTILLTQSARYRDYRTQFLISPRLGLDIGSAHLSLTRALVIVVAVLLMIALTYFVQRTRLGLAMRAVSIDREAAAMMGVDVDRVILSLYGLHGWLEGFHSGGDGRHWQYPRRDVGWLAARTHRNVCDRFYLAHLQRCDRFCRFSAGFADQAKRLVGRARPAEGVAYEP